MGLRRRDFLTTAAASVLAMSGPPWRDARAQAFDFAAVRAKAEELSKASYAAPEASVPEALRSLKERAYRQIRFRGDHALWHDGGQPFRVVFSHLGWLYQQPVAINLVDGAEVLTVPYRREMFDFGENGFAEGLGDDLGFAGFRVHHSLADLRDYPELASFDGSSRFRFIGHGQVYGAAARALAIDTATSSGEEIPQFREFWLQRPTPDAAEMTVYAILDSPGLSAAYQFVFRPGAVATMDVRAVLFPRRTIEKLGIAPLSSMFLFGESGRRRFDDYRPEVHDSDGLLIYNGRGEWLWRPLVNHGSLQISAFQDESPRGFGLLQRDRDFEDYQDLDHQYERRPSLWVEPIGPWGPGWVELVEIPSERETNDNIIAFWVKREAAEAGKPIEIAYRIHAQLDQPRRPPLAQAMATRTGPGNAPDSRRFVVDFAGGPLADLGRGAALEAVLKAHAGEVGEARLEFNARTGGWRATFDLFPNGEELCEMSLFLRRGGETMTETWLYRWTSA
jgi:periplasmic glucans biosynthesis protein